MLARWRFGQKPPPAAEAHAGKDQPGAACGWRRDLAVRSLPFCQRRLGFGRPWPCQHSPRRASFSPGERLVHLAERLIPCASSSALRPLRFVLWDAAVRASRVVLADQGIIQLSPDRLRAFGRLCTGTGQGRLPCRLQGRGSAEAGTARSGVRALLEGRGAALARHDAETPGAKGDRLQRTEASRPCLLSASWLLHRRALCQELRRQAFALFICALTGSPGKEWRVASKNELTSTQLWGSLHVAYGEVAQLGERRIRIAEVESSNLFFSTRRQKYRLVLSVQGGFCLTFSGKRLQKAPFARA